MHVAGTSRAGWMVTIRDVAAASGVSITTVSVVLSGKADERGIAQDTRARVIDAAARLGFRHNPSARALRTGRSNTIGLVGVLHDRPALLTALRLAAEELISRNFELALHDMGSPQRGGAHLPDLDPRHLAAVLVVSPSEGEGHHILGRAVERGIPVVALSDWDIPGADVVTFDREHGAYQATRHLLDLGHRSIALTVDPEAEESNLQDRIAGYRRAHRDAGVTVDPSLLISPDPNLGAYAQGLAIARALPLHPAHPTALFCVNDRVAVGALRGLFEVKARVPEDVALVGFDGLVESNYAAVPITTVVQPLPEMVHEAASILVRRLRGELTGPPRRVVIPPVLAVRKSSDPNALLS